MMPVERWPKGSWSWTGAGSEEISTCCRLQRQRPSAPGAAPGVPERVAGPRRRRRARFPAVQPAAP